MGCDLWARGCSQARGLRLKHSQWFQQPSPNPFSWCCCDSVAPAGGGAGKGRRQLLGAGSFTMENSTTNFTTNYTLYGSLDWEEFITDRCSSIPYSLIASAGVCLGISLRGLAGNGVVMWFLGFHTKQSPFTVYILNLAVADFSLLLLLLLAFLTLAAFCTSLLPFDCSLSAFGVCPRVPVPPV